MKIILIAAISGNGMIAEREGQSSLDWTSKEDTKFFVEKTKEFVFYDRNATLSYSMPFTDLSKLQTEIAWDLITEVPRLDGFCKYFFNNLNSSISFCCFFCYHNCAWMDEMHK